MLNLSKRLTSDSQRSIPLLLVLIVCALTAVSVSAQSVPAPLLAGDVVIEGSAANSIGPTEPVAYDVTVLGPKIAARIHSGNYSDNAPTPATGVGGLPSSSIWQWRQPLPQGNALHAVAAGNNTYVAVGDAGTVLSAPYLPDAVRDWTPTAPIIRQSLFDVAFRANALAPAGEGVFVAVGASGAVIRSTDGNRWSAVDSG